MWPRGALALIPALAACHYTPDYTGTNYRCDDGKCPSGYTCVAARCVLVGELDGAIDVPVDAAPLPWWNPSYSYRAPLTITDPSTQPLVMGFPVMVTIDLTTLPGGPGSFDAVRIAHWDAVAMQWVELSRYVEGTSTTKRWAWFGLAASLGAGQSSSDYYLYWAAQVTGTAPSSTSFFDVYDGFSATAIDSNRWTTLGTPAEAGDNVTLHAGDGLRSKRQFGPGFAVTMGWVPPANNPRYWGGFHRLNDFMDLDPWMVWVNRAITDPYFPTGASPATVWPETFDTQLGMTSPDHGTPAPIDGVKRYYTVQRLADRVVYKVDEQQVYEYALPMQSTDLMQVRLANEGTMNVPFAMVHVRKAVWPDPTCMIGATEMR